MNDLFSKTWVRWTIKCLYVLFWTILLLFSLYYTDILASGPEKLWSKITSDMPLGLDVKYSKIMLPLFVAMFLFWADAAYIKMIEINDTSVAWKNHLSSVMIGVFLLIGIFILMSGTHFGAFVSVISFFVVCCIYKLIITPLAPGIKVADNASWGVNPDQENPIEG